MSGLNNYMIHRVVEETTSYVNKKSKDAKGKRVKDELILDAAAGTICKIVGVLFTLFCVGLTIWAWHDGERGWVIWEFLLFTLLGIWLFGAGQFYKIVITPEKLVHHSSFFGIRRTFPLEKITRVVMTEDGKTIKVYKGKRKILSMEDQLASGKDNSIPYFEEAGIPIEDRRPKVNDFKVHQSNLYFVLGILLFVIITISSGWSIAQMIVVPEKRIENILPLTVELVVEMYAIYALLYKKFFYLKIVDNDVYYRNIFQKEKHFYFSDITGYDYDSNDGYGELRRVEVYKENETLAVVRIIDANADLLVAKMNQMKIPCQKTSIKDGDRTCREFLQKVKNIENKFLLKKNYLFRE